MLVLSRKIGEQIRIGDCVTITINRIRGNRVLLGIKAPPNVHIVRGELKPLAEKPDNGQAATNGTAHAAVSPIPKLRSCTPPGGGHAVGLPNESS